MRILEAFGSLLGKFIAFSEIDQEGHRKQSAPQQQPQLVPQQQHNYESEETCNMAEDSDEFETEETF